MVKVRVADLPTTSNVDPSSFVIIEKPNVGEGTYKSTVSDLQEAITVHAKVERDGQVTTITIDDINGHTEDSIVTPTAEIVDNGDGTVTIIITDSEGTTRETLLKNVAVIDPEPTEGSNNLVTSGTIYNLEQDINARIDQLSEDISDRLDQLESDINDKFDTVDEHLAEIDEHLAENDERLAFIEAIVKLVYYTDLLTETGDQVALETGETLEVPKLGSIAEMKEEGGSPADPFMVDGVVYETLSEAIAAAVEASQGTEGLRSPLNGNVVKLLGDTSNPALIIPEGSNIVIDLNGYTLTMVGPGVGSSPKTATLGFQLLKDSYVTFKNGVIRFNDPKLKMGIQNYCNLTLDNVHVWGSSTITYVVSNNYGNVKFKNGTIIEPTGSNIAFDAWYGMRPEYDVPGVNVTIEDDTVDIRGSVEFGKANRASLDNFEQYASITCPETIGLSVSILTPPCSWIDNGDGTKSLRYTPDKSSNK